MLPSLSFAFTEPQRENHSLSSIESTKLGDLVHVGVVVGGRGGLRSCSGSRGSALVTTEVVLHLSIELLSSLGLGLSGTAGLLLVGRLSSTGSTVGGGLSALCGALGLLLGGGLGLAVKKC